VTIEVPVLTHDDVRDALKKRLGTADLSNPAERARLLLAYFGRGEPGHVDVPSAGRFEIVPVRSELELRERLPPLQAIESRMAFLVPWPVALPLDIQGRFAGDRVHRIDKDSRLRRMFGVAEVDPAAGSSPLASYLVARPVATPLPGGAGRLTESLMWRIWLHAAWGLDVRDGLAGDALLAWAAFRGHGSQFVQAMRDPAAAGVRDALLAYLGRAVGPAAVCVWEAWELGRGSELFEWSLLLESLARSADPAVRVFTKQTVLQLFAVGDEGRAVEVATQLGEWVPGAVRFAEKRLSVSASELRARVVEADRRAVTSEIRAALVSSTRLPSGWQGRVERLGDALRAGAAAPAPEALAAAVGALRQLDSHDFYRDTERKQLVERAEMATRLLAWLATNPLSKLEEPLGSAGDVDLLGRFYVEHGGWIDRARRTARGGGGEGTFRAGVDAVLASVDALRTQLDRRFARALVAFHDQGRIGSHALPIDKAIERVVVRFLDRDPTRKVLVLLMDGMGWAQAVELLESMGRRAPQWGPLAWHSSAAGALGEAALPIVLASVPTLTDVSRAAFFAGKPLPQGTKPPTDRDIERFQAHPALAKFWSGASAPKLMLRGEGHGADGNLSSPARELVRDQSQRVVAIVVNAIDASLKADAQQRHRWQVDDVKSLHELLEVARAAGRAVLFCSDHGHVPADRQKNVGQATGGARWRPWASATSPVEEYEVAMTGPHVWTPKGAHGIVLLADDTTNYGGVSHAGEHGGASLAEVIAPCLLIGFEDHVAATEADPDLRVRELTPPSWWFHEVPQAVASVVPVAEGPAKRGKTKKTEAREGALVLPGLDAAPAAPPSTAPPPAPASPLTDNALLRAQAADALLRATVIKAVHSLRAKGGTSSEAALAAELGEPSWRIGGLMSKVEEVLNIDGYTVLQHDRVARQVHLNVELLCQLFEVKL
jgi:hypothetical protein